MKSMKGIFVSIMIFMLTISGGCGFAQREVDTLTADQVKVGQVEKARLKADNDAITSIAANIKMACTDAEIVSSLGKSTKITLSGGAGNDKSITFNTKNALEKVLSSSVGSSFATTSETYRNSAENIVFQITKEENGVEVEVIGTIDQVE